VYACNNLSGEKSPPIAIKPFSSASEIGGKTGSFGRRYIAIPFSG